MAKELLEIVAPYCIIGVMDWKGMEWRGKDGRGLEGSGEEGIGKQRLKVVIL